MKTAKETVVTINVDEDRTRAKGGRLSAISSAFDIFSVGLKRWSSGAVELLGKFS